MLYNNVNNARSSLLRSQSIERCEIKTKITIHTFHFTLSMLFLSDKMFENRVQSSQ